MTNILELADQVGGQREHVEAPYRCGDRICATSPEGVHFLARVELVKPAANGQFTILAAVTEPRRFRSHLLTTVVDADGYGPAVRPAA
jgi:hypothetical protein